MNIKKYIRAAESDYIRIGNKMIPKDTSKFSYEDSYDDISDAAKRDYQAELDAQAAEEKRQADIARGKINYESAFANVDPAASIDDQLSAMFDALVPPSGKCDNLGGELVRAMTRILYRDYNDGDVFYEGYGLETCGPDAAFIMDHSTDDIFDKFCDIAEGGEIDDAYTQQITDVAATLIEYLKDTPEIFGQDTESCREYSSSTLEEIAEAAPKYEYDPDLSGDLERYIDNDCISWRDVYEQLYSWARYDLGGTVNQWALDGFRIEDLDREHLEEWESRFDEFLSQWLDDLESEFPNYGETEEEDEYEEDEYDEEE